MLGAAVSLPHPHSTPRLPVPPPPILHPALARASVPQCHTHNHHQTRSGRKHPNFSTISAVRGDAQDISEWHCVTGTGWGHCKHGLCHGGSLQAWTASRWVTVSWTVVRPGIAGYGHHKHEQWHRVRDQCKHSGSLQPWEVYASRTSAWCRPVSGQFINQRS